MKSILKKLSTYAIFLTVFSITNVYSQSVINIDYYGVVANEIDENMYKMTSDLYFTQLCEIPLFSITDKRNNEQLIIAPPKERLSNTNLSFYAVIEKKDESKWISTLIVVNTKKNSKNFESKEYDSYYKILTEPKTVLQETLKNLITQNSKTEKENNEIQDTFTTSNYTTEILSGTWDGEDVIDKIVIMRGGRGFVIFKNGASMNISIQLDEINKKINILQNAKSNASFFPDLPRQTALKVAVDASPIEWNFELKDDNTLTGTKKTLLLDSDNNIKEGIINVTWKRRS